MADKNLDEYKPLKFYKANSKARQNGFAKFKDGDSHYFALYKDCLLYTSPSPRDS